MHQAALPYYAVIFTSHKKKQNDSGYQKMSDRMFELVKEQPGFISYEHVHNPDGQSITISYWKDKKSIRAWREHTEHWIAQELGKTKWYDWYNIRICKVERAYGNNLPD
ncbi:antibiotic biosynthesis monooxygenase family protein [Poriferisphaera sp. WC338]|uniref:antibiotic biosynthesis monooxygenase family protein n=1 Tax=Poriferisphaera sp. WC338 TaxID=3425129 RepID=UPI003D81B6CD